ncbi:hypothetical protein AAMO2058_000337700 [Amorphochlora amoebiformis]
MEDSKTNVKTVLKDVLDYKKETNWVILTAKTGKVEVVSSGSGLKKLLSFFGFSEMQWGLINVLGIDKSSSINSTRSKLVQINWCGAGVPHGDRGKMINKQKPLIQQAAGSIACELPAEKKEDITGRKIAYNLYHAQGAHKPTHYNFGDGEVASEGLTTADNDPDDEDEDEDFD